MIYREKISLKKELLERVNALLDIPDLSDLSEEEQLLNPKEDDFIGLMSIDFANGYIIDIDVCSGTGNYYDNCVLKDANGNEITCFDCSYSIDNEMEFNYGDDTYIVTIEAESPVAKTNKEILDIFGEYEKVIMDIGEQVVRGVSLGSMEWVFYREDYDEITPEMEEVFDGEDVASICIEWSLDIG